MSLLLRRELVRAEGERELAVVLRETNEGDPDWIWERVNATRNKPPADQNGADIIPSIKKLIRPGWGTEFASAEWQPLLEVPPNVRYSPRVITQVRRELTDSADAVRLARTLKDRPFGHREIVLKPNVLDTPLQETQDTRTVADLLRWDVVLAVEDSDLRRAGDDLLALVNAARSIGDEPFIISQFVRLAICAIAINSAERFLAQTLDAPSLAELQRVFAEEAEEPLLLFAVRGERATLDRLFERIQNNEIPLGHLKLLSRGITPEDQPHSGTRESPWARLGWWYNRTSAPADRAFMIAWLSKHVDAARRPVHEQPALVAAIPELPNDQHTLARLFLPAVEKMAHAHWRTAAIGRCAAVGVACERFRQKALRWPDTLHDLVPAFLPAIPLDPYDGQPLRYAKSENGVSVYSVGKRPSSRVGRFEVNTPVPTAKLGLPDGIEFGFRLWNPDQRRLPLIPDPAKPERRP